MKKKYNFTLTQQVSESISIEFLDEAGSPRALTGYEFKLDCKKNYNELEPQFTLSSADNTIVLDATNTNKITLYFNHELTKTLNFDKAEYDLITYLPDKSKVEVLMSGTVTLNRTITSLD